VFKYRSAAVCAAICALILCLPPQVQAQGTPGLRSYAGLALSPAGDRIALVESGSRGVVIRSAADGKLVQQLDPCAGCTYGAPQWSPDGRALAFLATTEGVATLYVAAEATEPVAVVKLSGLMSGLRWSSDGQRIAFLLVEGARKQTGATQAGVPLVGEIGQAPDSQRIAYISRAGGPLAYASPLGTYVYEFDWQADDKGFVATEAQGDGDANWWVAKLAAHDLVGTARIIAAPAMQMNRPAASPDGKSVALIGGLMSDFGSVGGDVYLAPLGGGEPRDVTPGFKGSVTNLFWRGSRLMGTALIGDRAAIIEISPAGAAPKVLWSQPVSMNASLSADGERAAMVVQDFEHPPQLRAGPVAAPAAISHDNDAIPARVHAQSITWKSDGFTVQGWLVSPLNPKPGKRPMVVEIHGGPSAASSPGYVEHGGAAQLIDRGYSVFYPNPRGSYGQGEAFARANYRDFGGGDLRDILAGIDAVEKIAPVDDSRLAITGVSYGGFMTMWAVTHTSRFAAAVAGAGVSDWLSYYGENGINTWLPPFFGATAYEDPAIYLKLSPISSIRKAKTPTFIWVGERDIECPPAQSIEFYHGLKEVGAPASLVIYPGEGHGVRQPANAADVNRRTLALFDKYLGPRPTSAVPG
jgi:dipeptidyl aminopeptidase/acylaminoacyl peptidase